MIGSFLAIYSIFLLVLAVWLLLTDRRLEIIMIGFLIVVQALMPWIFKLSSNMTWRPIELLLLGSLVFHVLAVMRVLLLAFRRLGKTSSDELQIFRG